MTRDDLIRALVDKQGHVSYKLMCTSVKHITDTMVDALSNGARIEVRGFGSFALRNRPPRLARNPRTGITLHTERKFAVHFKPGKELKEKVNNAYQKAN
jgi:integration host factor subunit beta